MSTDFNHGVEVVDVQDGARTISTVKSAIIGLLGTAGKGDINTATLVTSYRQGVLKFGAWDDRDAFTIPEALDAIYDQTSASAGAQVVVINVAGTPEHLTAIVKEDITFSTLTQKAALAHRFVSSIATTTAVSAPMRVPANLTLVLPAGCVVTGVKDKTGAAIVGGKLAITPGQVVIAGDAGVSANDTVTVAYTATLVNGKDYTLDADAGVLTRTIGLGGKLLAGASISLGYSFVDASKVTQTALIGGVNSVTGNYEGVHAFLGSKSILGIAPRIVIMPRWDHQKPDAYTRNAVVAEAEGVLSKLKAIAFINGPNTTDEAAVMFRQDWANRRIMIVDPWVKVVGPSGATVHQPASSRWAGVKARVDQENGFWWSPSNKEINGISGTSRPVEFALGDPSTRANYLNANEVSTIINEQGYRTWGNRTTSDDPKYAFLSVQVISDMVAESILLAHLWAVDRNITKTFVASIVEGVNNYLRYLKNQGAIINGKAWADPELNTPDVIAAGQVFIDYDFTPVFPAERVTFRQHLVNDYLVEVFA